MYPYKSDAHLAEAMMIGQMREASMCRNKWGKPYKGGGGGVGCLLTTIVAYKLGGWEHLDVNTSGDWRGQFNSESISFRFRWFFLQSGFGDTRLITFAFDGGSPMHSRPHSAIAALMATPNPLLSGCNCDALERKAQAWFDAYYGERVDEELARVSARCKEIGVCV